MDGLDSRAVVPEHRRDRRGRTHYTTDIAVDLAVLAALAITLPTHRRRADPVFALGISGYMLWNARSITVEVIS